MQSNFFTRNKETLISLLSSLLIQVLKLQLVGGFRGWLFKNLAEEFSEEIVETLEVVNGYKITKEKLNDTIDMEDRDAATDQLNDVWL